MSDKIVNLIKETIEDLLSKMGYESKTESEILSQDLPQNTKSLSKIKDEQDILRINVNIDEPSLLIGRDGFTLKSLEHLVRLQVRKKIGKVVPFVVDIDDYKKRKEDFLRELAQDAASRVRASKHFVVLKSMTGFERRIIHTELSKFKDVYTESLGEEPNRRVVVKFKVQSSTRKVASLPRVKKSKVKS